MSSPAPAAQHCKSIETRPRGVTNRRCVGDGSLVDEEGDLLSLRVRVEGRATSGDPINEVIDGHVDRLPQGDDWIKGGADVLVADPDFSRDRASRQEHPRCLQPGRSGHRRDLTTDHEQEVEIIREAHRTQVLFDPRDLFDEACLR